MSLKGNTLNYCAGENSPEATAIQYLHRAMDPYFDILQNTLRERPSFLKDVQEKRTALFPNFINGDFRPNMRQGAQLKLHTSPGQKTDFLRNVGAEFWSYQQPLPQTISDPGWMR